MVATNEKRKRGQKSASRFSLFLLVASMLGISYILLNDSAADRPFPPENYDTGETNAVAMMQESSVLPCPDVNNLRETCLDPFGPQPYILMTLGRSGSGSTWQVIGNLTGYETPSEEYTGSGQGKSEKFFFQWNDGADNDRWLLKNLCFKQLQYHQAAVVGFKWKPFDTIFSPSAQAGLRRIASLQRPQIKVVRSKRNLLDVAISKHKHSIHNGRSAAAHCLKGDKKCLEKSLKASTGLELPTDELLDYLRELDTVEKKVDQMLVDMRIPHVQVSYEKLYYGEDTSEWIKIFEFLGVGPARNLTKTQLEGAMEHVATHAPTQNITLGNFEEVSELLRGTEFESLLH